MEKNSVVFGTGPLGITVAEELASQGRKVVLLNRSGKPPGGKVFETKKCDALNKKEVIEVCKNVDSIYHCIGLPYQEWENSLPKIMDNIIEGASQSGTKIVYADNLYAYGPQQWPLTEDLPYKPLGKKTRVRAEVATTLMEAEAKGIVRATIGRGADFYGPFVKNSVLGERVFKHLMIGKPVELLGNPDTYHSHIFIKDFAKGIVKIGSEEKANGEVWHFPCAELTTTRKLVEQTAATLGVEANYRVANKFLVSMAGLFNPVMRELKEMMYQHTKDFIVDSTKYDKAFGRTVTPYDHGIKETIGWYKENGNN